VTPYRIQVEGLFIDAEGLKGEVDGFFTTFYVKANDAVDACERVGNLVKARMKNHSVTGDRPWPYQAYFWAQNMWEITEEEYDEYASRDLGFTFFPLMAWEKLYLVMRGVYLRSRKPTHAQFIRVSECEEQM
jgi:hypothetical protein